MTRERHREDLLTVPELARATGIGERTLREAIDRGALNAYRPGLRSLRVFWGDFLDWIRSRPGDGRNAAEANDRNGTRKNGKGSKRTPARGA